MSRDPSFPSNSSSASQEAQESMSGQTPSRKLKVTLLSSEWQSTKGGLSTLNRELAIQLAKYQNVEVSMYLPECSEEDVRIAGENYVKLIKAKVLYGYKPIDWLSSLPANHQVDYVIGHGLKLGRQVQLIQKQLRCKWVQVVHTAPEYLGMFKGYANAISKAEEKHEAEIRLCELADQVVAVGPKLADVIQRNLRQKNKSVFELTPSIFSEFSTVKQAAEEGAEFHILVFGRGDSEDFELKGYDIAAKAISQLNEDSYRLIFVGAPPGKEKEVTEKLCRHGIKQTQLRVRPFTESREDLFRLFCEVDLCIMPSRIDGFGLVALEALSAGLPVLVSGNSGLGDALQNVPGGRSCVVNSEDPAEWAKAIKSVRKMRRDVRLKDTKNLCIQYAEEYSWEKQCGELLKMMFDSAFGTHQATEGEQESPLTRSHLPTTVVCEGYVEPTDKKGKRPLHPSVIPPSKKQGHDTDICRGTRHASESEQESSLPTPMVAEASVEPTGKRPLHPSVTPPSKKQKHDTDFCRGISERQTAEMQQRHVTDTRNAAIADSVVVKLLRQEYKRRAEFRPLLWSTGKDMKLHLDEVYTRLKIVVRPKGLGDSEIDLGNIFCCNKGEDSMVIAEGSPGIGKTTLCLKLAYDWAKESMPSTFPVFELVLLLRCRDFDGDIMKAISEQLLPEDIKEKTKKRLWKFVMDIHNQERILIILDGLDELPEKSKHHVDKLLHRRILTFCYVLATTRQEKGIEARRQFSFDICLLIKGFSEKDSLEYIRKHFKNVDPSKGERLIEETKENTLLHALQSNPLNLLLLCVVYEDHEGKLPSSRTDLYQIIVRCILRRYCVKRSVKARKRDGNLEKQFEADLLVLGQLAWNCLLSDRHSFRERELKEFERSDDKLVVRYLGLVYKEESLKRLKPRHEYFFLHKSFQEYLAASYIAHKLRRNQFNVFEHVKFYEVVKKFPQVFLFVCGILREEAIILFTQIGEELEYGWDWLECSEEEVTFFAESFSESGNPERMANALFSFIPFPRVVHLSLFIDNPGADLELRYHWNPVEVLRACTGFSKVQTPDVHIEIPRVVLFRNLKKLQSLPKIKTLDISYEFGELQECDDWESVAELLKTSETLEKVTFSLWNESGEGWARALDAGLCADTPLSSVGLRIHGSLSETAMKALKNLLRNKSLSSLSIHICGDMQDSLAVAIVTGLAGQIAVKVVDLCVDGKLSLRGANSIERGIVENNSLTTLMVSLRGEVPENWQAVGRNIHSRIGRERSASFALYPNTFGKVTAAQVTPCCPFKITDGLLAQQNVTLNVWGELGGDGAEALFEGLSRKQVSHLTLDIHGKLTDDILNFTARWVDKRKTLSSLTINTWEQLTKEEKTLFKELKLDKNPAVTLNVRDVPAPSEESRDDEFVCVDDNESLIALFKEAKNTGKQSLNATINIDSGDDYFSPEPEVGLDHVLASNITLNALSLAFNFDDNTSDSSWFLRLRDGLARNTSLKNLTLVIENHSRAFGNELDLGWVRNTSVENLFVTVINRNDLFVRRIWFGLADNKSLKNVTLTINNFGSLMFKRENCGLVNKSLNDFSLTINNYGEILSGIPGFVRRFQFLTTFNVTLNLCGEGDNDTLDCFFQEAMESESLKTLRLKVNYRQITNGSCGYDFSKFVVISPSLSLIELTFSLYGGEESSRK
ncbi:uncharacterized protein [Montipora capricornis]|uniref:uncharacterized protein n=1 Tax=Montipora capricornis TaxID=246305 RepID=UPI0035F20DAA